MEREYKKFVDAEAICAAYANGASVREVAAELQVRESQVRKCLHSAGIMRTRAAAVRHSLTKPGVAERRLAATRAALTKQSPDLQRVRDLYEEGTTLGEIASLFDTSYRLAKVWVLEAGCTLRSNHEVGKRSWNDRTEEARVATLDSLRNNRNDYYGKLGTAKALADERDVANVGVGERELQEMLNLRGLYPTPQKAVWVYNCDLGLAPVTIEVEGGKYHPYAKPSVRERIPALTEMGWLTWCVWLDRERSISETVADQIVEWYRRLTERDPSALKHRVIRDNGRVIDNMVHRRDAERSSSFTTPTGTSRMTDYDQPEAPLWSDLAWSD